VKTAKGHDLGRETRQGQGNDATPRPLDGSENWTEIVTETETIIGNEMSVTGMPIVRLLMILAAGETTANAKNAWQPDANSGTKNIGTGSVTAKRSAVPESANETRIGILTVPVIENVTVGSWTNVIQGPNEPMDVIGVRIVETRTEANARNLGLESRRRNPLGWMLTFPTNLERAFLVVRLKMGSWMAFKHGNWI
jgi:hypothetical protein